MMKKLSQLIVGFAAIIGLLGMVSPVQALDPLGAGCQAAKNSEFCKQTNNSQQKVPNLIQNIISTLLFVLGIISVIMIIVGGIQYALGGGDSNQLTRAKNTIMYAVIGLVVALLSYGIVYFIVDALK